MKIRKFGDALFTITEYFPINFRIFGQTVDELTAITNYTRHIYIIEKFKPNFFIKNDILNPKIMVPDIGKNKLQLGIAKTQRLNLMSKTLAPQSNE